MRVPLANVCKGTNIRVFHQKSSDLWGGGGGGGGGGGMYHSY